MTTTINTGNATTAKILCVDDETHILSAMRRLFRPSGYHVLIADSAAKGLEIIEQEKGNINAIISDMRMPNMNGAEFLAKVRQKYPNIMRILLTGYSDMDSTVDAINEGQIYRYVSKPWNENDLIACVKEALNVQHLKAEKERLEKLTQEQNQQLKTLNASLEEKVAKRTADLRIAHERMKKNFLTSIKIFSSLIELRGGKVAGHSRRTADLARKIAVNMKLPIKDVNDIFLAGLLHDIGKIGFSDELLNKPPIKMTIEERKIFCEHAIKGEELLMPLEDMRGAATIIRSHHEHFDGNGYPEKLAGEQIPLGARILAVANEHDGLIEGTLTGKIQSGFEVRNYIHNNAGKRYDPKVVAIYEKLLWSGANAPSAPTITPVMELSPEIQAEIQKQNIVGLPEDEIELKDEIKEVQRTVFGLIPGMKLSRDLFSSNGTMLLAADFVLDSAIIRKLSHYVVQHHERNITVYIYDPEDEIKEKEKEMEKEREKAK